MKKTKKALASLAIASMALTMIPINAFATGTVPTRLSGTTAAQTAVAIADQTGWTGTAILASSLSYGMVDALTAGPLAFSLKAPILLTGAGALDADTKAELTKLAVKTVYVTSGTAVISQAVLDELTGMGITVVPLGGVDRAATSVNIAKKMVGVTKVAVANGLQDALSIAAIASAANQPILLTDKDAVPASVAAYLAANPSITSSDVIGGTGIISDAVKAMFPGATRHAGNSAYDTNNQVIQDFNAALTYGNVYLANGVTGIDALAGAPLAALTKSAIVLTDGVATAAATFVNGKLTGSSVVTALGGAAVVPAGVLAGVAYEAPAVLSVESVSAINLKQVEIKFNKAFNATEAAKISNYTFTKADGTDLLTSGSVAVDGNKVTVTLSTAMTNFSTDNKIKVLKAVGLDADYSNDKVGASDTTFPTLVSASVTGPREITMTFSEPVQNAALSAFTVDGGAFALNAVDASGTKLKLTTLADLTEGSHTVVLKSNSTVVDYANLVALSATLNFNYVKDTTAPTVSVKSSTETSVTLKFSKTVSNINTANVLFSHTYKGSNQVAGDSGAVTGSGDEYTITFITALPPGTAKVYVDYVANTTDVNKIKDNFGNVLAPVALDVTTVADTVKPAVSSIEFVSPTSVKVNLSEAVNTTEAQTVANYTLKDSTGTAVAVTGASLDATGKVVTLTTAEINGGSYSLTVKSLKDKSVAGNVMDEATVQFTASDKVAPKISDLDSTTANVIDGQLLSTKKVKVVFSEVMKKASIENKDNYQFAGAALPTGTTVTASADLKFVVFDFTNADPATNPASGTIKVGRVADAAGNLIAVLSTDVLVPGTVSAPLFNKAEVTGAKQVTFYFDEVITGAVAGDFAVDPNTGTFANVTAISVTVADGKTTVVATTADTLPGNAAGVKVTTTVTPAGQNEYASKISIANTTTAADKFAPTLDTATNIQTVDADADGKIDHIKLIFSEVIAAGTVSTDKFTVEGYTVADAFAATGTLNGEGRSGVTVADSVDVYVAVTEVTTGTDSNATPKVTVGTGIKDVAGNAYAGLATATASVDKVAPVAPTVTNTVASYINIANKAAYHVTGTAEVGSTVTVTLTDLAATPTVKTGTAIANATTGAFDVVFDTTVATALLDGNVTISVTAKDAALNTSPATSVVVVRDIVDVTVTTQIAAAATLTADATHTLVFSEALDAASRTSVKTAVDAAYTKNGTATVSSAWGTDNKTLTVTITAAASPNDVVFAAIADQVVTDLAGNTSAALDVQQ